MWRTTKFKCDVLQIILEASYELGWQQQGRHHMINDWNADCNKLHVYLNSACNGLNMSVSLFTVPYFSVNSPRPRTASRDLDWATPVLKLHLKPITKWLPVTVSARARPRSFGTTGACEQSYASLAHNKCLGRRATNIVGQYMLKSHYASHS